MIITFFCFINLKSAKRLFIRIRRRNIQIDIESVLFRVERNGAKIPAEWILFCNITTTELLLNKEFDNDKSIWIKRIDSNPTDAL